MRFHSSAKLLAAPNERWKFMAKKYEGNTFFACLLDLFIQAQFSPSCHFGWPFCVRVPLALGLVHSQHAGFLARRCVGRLKFDSSDGTRTYNPSVNRGKPAPNQDDANQLSATRTRGNPAGTLARYGHLWMQFTDRRRTVPPFQGQLVKAVPYRVMGFPHWGAICTSHVERQNLSIRMGIRCFCSGMQNGNSK